MIGDIRALTALRPRSSPTRAKELRAPVDLVRRVAEHGTAAGAELRCRRHRDARRRGALHGLGAEAVFVGSGIFKSQDPAARARAIVHATTHWEEPEEVLAASRGLGEAMEGIEMETLAEHERLANRGW